MICMFTFNFPFPLIELLLINNDFEIHKQVKTNDMMLSYGDFMAPLSRNLVNLEDLNFF